MRTSIVVLFCISFVLSWSTINLNWGKKHWNSILKHDARGYYAYLPAVFIYQDLNFNFFDSIEAENSPYKTPYFDYRNLVQGGKINKYYCGTALVQLPFFGMAHVLSWVMEEPLNGYSKWYIIFMSIAAVFYVMIGLVFLNLTLDFYLIQEGQKSLILVLAIFATNLFYYTVCEPGMSHVFSFAFISMFVYYAHHFFKQRSPLVLLYLSILLAIIVLIRPVNALIVLALPFLAGSYLNLKNGVFECVKKYKILLISTLCFFLILSVQFILYKIATGSYLVYSYTHESFNFFKPHVFALLFSYKKGLFVYTPLYLVSCLGLYFLWKTSRFKVLSWLLFFGSTSYVLSSWWMWYYGGSFSSRVFVEFIPLFMIVLAISLKEMKPNFKNAYIGVLIVLLVGCQIQTYQYRRGHIHWGDMNKEKYWEVFMRVDRLF